MAEADDMEQLVTQQAGGAEADRTPTVKLIGAMFQFWRGRGRSG